MTLKKKKKEKNKTLALHFQQNLNICWTHPYKKVHFTLLNQKLTEREGDQKKKANQSGGKLVWRYCLLHEIPVSRRRQTYCTQLQLSPQHRLIRIGQISEIWPNLISWQHSAGLNKTNHSFFLLATAGLLLDLHLLVRMCSEFSVDYSEESAKEIMLTKL